MKMMNHEQFHVKHCFDKVYYMTASVINIDQISREKYHNS